MASSNCHTNNSQQPPTTFSLSTMWACTACSYHNLNSTSTKCHICYTARGRSGMIPPAVIDLTDFRSPRNGECSASNEGGNNVEKRRSSDMESNRSRRRRLNGKGGLFENNEVSKNAGDRPSNAGATSADDVVMTNDYFAAEKAVHSKKRKDAGDYRTSKQATSTTDVAAANSIKKQTDSNAAETMINGQPVLEILSDDDDMNNLPPQVPMDHRKPKPATSVHMEPAIFNSESVRQRPLKESAGGHLDDINKRSTHGCCAPLNSYRNSTSKTYPKESQNKKTTTNSRDEKQSNTARLTDFYNKQNHRSASIETLMERATSILKKTFGHSSLRSLQQIAVQRALQRTNQIIVMATGSGKSICYQLPALVANGRANGSTLNVRAEDSLVTIVVCPLIALMVDQVNNLHKKGVFTAACLSSSQTAAEKSETLKRLRLEKNDASKGKSKVTSQSESQLTPIQLLYCTPELIKTERFRCTLNKLYSCNRLFQIAIDEAHCVSTWGHDFRTAYKELSWLRESFPDVPVMACTGTATSKVIHDIRDILCLDINSAPCLMGTFNRENISYEVRFKDSLNATATEGALIDLTKVIQKQHDIASKKNEPCSGIVYVHKREDCVSLAARISKMTGLVTAPYHAGLKDSDREETQRKWTDGIIRICVATVAFGMGIDLAHVRYVIHWTMAKSLEGFYQESGRGGRDGKPTLSILYYSKDDAEKFAYIIKKKAESLVQKKGSRDRYITRTSDYAMVELEGMIDYCTKPGCRRKHVLEHFGEKFDPKSQCNKTCDYCKDPNKVKADTKAAECMSAVINSQRLIHAGRNGSSKRDEKPFHRNPLESDESQDDEYESDGFLGTDDGILGVPDHAKDDFESGQPKQNGFVKASSVLSKYEKMECQEGKKGGFVNFKTRIFDSEDAVKKQRPVEIPEHLRSNMPDPLAGTYKKPNQENQLKPRSSYASEAERLQAELQALQREREAARAKLLGSLGSSSNASSGLSAPTLSFKKRR
ncbi:hypothetical protein HJC23_005783 [Cyclotella cryptica]|uniref:ATP-dependent DNA helicase n=1 Tax=Cyclotella cryptica TaxID=29204 RepID=A0ABD3PCJ3_9STRA|eukprot:CCRYP_016747-RA/>CCRYP_016747-RA protein AED:0.07 eAED:0.07 QI:53/1/1/1/0.66/0.6/10/1227/997